LASALLILSACSSTLEGVLEIRTTALETVTRFHETDLNPMGDGLDLPIDARNGRLRIDAEAPVSLPAGAKVRLRVEETGSAPGVRSSVLIDGEEHGARAGRVRVRVEWTTIEERRLPPKVELVPIELEPGETFEVDRTVMYTPMEGSVLENVETRVCISGPDQEKLAWVPKAPPERGRVRGRVVVKRPGEPDVPFR